MAVENGTTCSANEHDRKIDANHVAIAGTDAHARFVRGFRWNDDDNTNDWKPQGLSSSFDAMADGQIGGRTWLLASWHNDDDTRTRLSFVDISDPQSIRYRHVLLVEPAMIGLPTFLDVRIHAGGIAWYGTHVYVADTRWGLRVFDTSRIKQVATGDHAPIGRQPGNIFHAHDYRYVIPQVARYHPIPGFVARWSFCALDRSTLPHAVVTGEYENEPAGLPCQLYWWPLADDGWLLRVAGLNLTPAVMACNSTDSHLQGVHSRREGATTTAWLSSTKGDDDALLRRVVDHPDRQRKFHWPDKPEGLTYFPPTDELWSASEKTNRRVVFSVHRADL